MFFAHVVEFSSGGTRVLKMLVDEAETHFAETLSLVACISASFNNGPGQSKNHAAHPVITVFRKLAEIWLLLEFGGNVALHVHWTA